ncbi:MAG: pyridoxal-phosphate dependent enzyme [Polyangiaceae bacterium]
MSGALVDPELKSNETSPRSSWRPHQGLPRLALAHLPTPLWRNSSLSSLIGADLWVKRDDMSAGAEAGNKIRKLEYLLAEAIERDANHVITCGAVQSNHARATALLAKGLGLSATLLLRAKDPSDPGPETGNLALDRMVGADCRFITHAQYADRKRLLGDVAAELTARGERPYIIPEGGSNGLGAIGYFEAMREIREQLECGLGPGLSSRATHGFDLVVHACGSGGTAAGISLGAGVYGVAQHTAVMAVCDDVDYFSNVVRHIEEEARGYVPALSRSSDVHVFDQFKGPAYGIPSAEQRVFIREVASCCGLIVDPVYSGKALWGLRELLRDPARYGLSFKPSKVLFIHTGGLPGLLASPS